MDAQIGSPHLTIRQTAGLLAAAVISFGLSSVAAAQLGHPKRGLAMVNADESTLLASNASWYYTWGRNPGTPGVSDATYAPMFWGRWGINTTNINAIVNDPAVDMVLGFNEPDRSEQANMSVTEAVGLWDSLYNGFLGTGKSLVSPAVTDNAAGKQWLVDFKAGIEANGQTVDKVAFHWYGWNNPKNIQQAANNFINSATWYYDLWNKPVTVTEFAINDWNGSYGEAEMREANRQFLDLVLPWLDATPWIDSYAWYNWFDDSNMFERYEGPGRQPLRPAELGYTYAGVIHDGATYDIAGVDHGSQVAYLDRGNLTNSLGTGTLKHIDAMKSDNTIGGAADWSMTGSDTWVRIAESATLRKVGGNTVALDETTLDNRGTLEIVDGTLSFDNNAPISGDGVIRVMSEGQLNFGGQSRNTSVTFDEHLKLVGGRVSTTGSLTNGLNIGGGGMLSGRGAVDGELTIRSGATLRPESTQVEQLIDDFSGNLNDYTITRLINGNGGFGNEYTWRIREAGVEVVTNWHNGDEETALTRDDVTLGVGQELRAAYNHANLSQRDVGLYIGAGTPTLDVRRDFLNVFVSANGTVSSRGFNGNTILPIAGGDAVIPDELFIHRVDTDTFELGYYVNGIRSVITTRDVGNTAIGDAVGFYADIRSGGRRGALDDLTLIQPEGGPLTAGLLDIQGDLHLNAGSVLEIDLFDEGLSDHLDIARQFIANGDLAVSYAGFSSMEEGASYDLFDFASISGAFGDIVLPALSDGLLWDTSALLTEGILAVVSAVALPGDFDGDGLVAQGDLNLVLSHWGVDTSISGIPSGWINELPDGPVDQAELNAVLSNWGAAAAPSFGGSAIPEPATAAWAFVGALAISRRVNRRF
ncbi:MAG: glycosyl hydrolase [Planctomycetota bacterium]